MQNNENFFVIDALVFFDWSENFSNRNSEDFKELAKNFKNYVENGYNSDPKYPNSRINITVERISKSFEDEEHFASEILVTFKMEVENLEIYDEDLNLDGSTQIWDEIFDFFSKDGLTSYFDRAYSDLDVFEVENEIEKEENLINKEIEVDDYDYDDDDDEDKKIESTTIETVTNEIIKENGES